MKDVFRRLVYRLQGFYAGVTIFLKATFGGTGEGVILVSALVSSILLGSLVGQLKFPAVSVFLCCILALPLLVLMAELLNLLLRLVLGSSRRTAVYGFLQFLLVYVYLIETPTAADVENLVTAVIQCWLFCFLGRSLWACCYHRRFSLINIISVILLLAEGIAVVAFLTGPGFRGSAISSYTQIARSVPLPVQKHIDTTPGPYEVKTLTYGTGSESDLFSRAYDMTGMAGQSKLAEWNRKLALGHTLDETPVQGIIWYPEGGEKCPILLIVHGNHTYLDESYKGYEYLGTYLASHGYVVVSVDENMCNLLGDENDARGGLLLESLWFLKAKLLTSKPELRNQMDFTNIALAGHSRGGEAVTSAWLFNRLRTNPDNGMMTFTDRYSIKSIIAIAPTVDQYEPAGHAVELQDVNYLLIHGTNDQDVTTVMGNKQYNNISWPSADADHTYLKSSLYVGGANHGQFNTEWGRYDSSFPVKNLLNVGNLLPAEDQRTVLQLFVKTFLDVTLKGDETHADLLKNYRAYLDCLPDTVYQQRYETSGRTVIADFEEDANLKTASIAGGTMNGSDLASWYERKWWYGNSGEKENHLLVLEAGDETAGTYSVGLLPSDCSGRNFVFDVADFSADAEKEPELLDMGITVRDTAGNTARVELREIIPVYPTVWVQLTKQDYLWNKKSERHQMQTVTIPFSLFAEKNEALDLTAVDRMVFTLDSESVTKVIVDNMGIE